MALRPPLGTSQGWRRGSRLPLDGGRTRRRFAIFNPCNFARQTLAHPFSRVCGRGRAHRYVGNEAHICWVHDVQ